MPEVAVKRKRVSRRPKVSYDVALALSDAEGEVDEQGAPRKKPRRISAKRQAKLARKAEWARKLALDKEDEAPATQNKKLLRAFEYSTLSADASHVSLNTRHDLASHLFYAETVRRGLLGAEGTVAEQAAHSLSSWASWPLKKDDLPESYPAWTLADEVLAIVARQCGEWKRNNLVIDQVDELIGAPIVLHSLGVVEGVLHNLAVPLLGGRIRPRAHTTLKANSAKVPDKPFDWRAILSAASSIEGLPPEVLDRAHARLSELYRPGDIEAHRLPPVPRTDPREMSAYKRAGNMQQLVAARAPRIKRTKSAPSESAPDAPVPVAPVTDA